MGYAITTPKKYFLAQGGMNWDWVSAEKSFEKLHLLFTTTFISDTIPAAGGHFAMCLFATGPGISGEVHPHPNHPGAVRTNPLWVRGIGTAHGAHIAAFERWDGSDFYLKHIQSPQLINNTIYMAELLYNFCSRELVYRLFRRVGFVWNLETSQVYEGWGPSAAQVVATEPYWYAAFGAIQPPTALIDDGLAASDLRMYVWDSGWDVEPSITPKDPEYRFGQVNEPVANTHSFTVLQMRLETQD